MLMTENRVILKEGTRVFPGTTWAVMSLAIQYAIGKRSYFMEVFETDIHSIKSGKLKHAGYAVPR